MDIRLLNNTLSSLRNQSNSLLGDLNQKGKQNDRINSKLEVVTINGYKKHYIVLPNGKRVLISESKEQESLKNSISKQETKNNTEEVMDFLNHLLGGGSSGFKGL